MLRNNGKYRINETMSAKRDALRMKLIDAAEQQMKANGLTGLRARDITKDAGCALGGLYNAFGDLNELVLHVNARTLDRLNVAIATARKGLAPKESLLAIALAYTRFAQENRALWDALYDHKIPDDAEIPAWFRSHQSNVISHVIHDIAALQPSLPEKTRLLRASTYFSAIHGIVAISLQGRFLGLPADHLYEEIERFVGYILSGSLGASGKDLAD